MSSKSIKFMPNFKDCHSDYIPDSIELDDEKAQKLEELSKLVDDKLTTDEGYKQELNRSVFLRYLTANKWAVDNAFKALSATMLWRNEFKVNELKSSDFLVEGKTGKLYCDGFGKNNNPILYLTPARQNTSDIEKHLRFTVFSTELAIKMMPPGVEKIIVVIDLREYTLKSAVSFSETRQILSIFAHHYPERLGRVILLEAPWVFLSFFKVISPFIDPVTRSKILFSSLSKKDNHISNFIPKESLYKDFGGYSGFVFDSSVYFENVEKFFR